MAMSSWNYYCTQCKKLAKFTMWNIKLPTCELIFHMKHKIIATVQWCGQMENGIIFVCNNINMQM